MPTKAENDIRERIGGSDAYNLGRFSGVRDKKRFYRVIRRPLLDRDIEDMGKKGKREKKGARLE